MSYVRASTLGVLGCFVALAAGCSFTGADATAIAAEQAESTKNPAEETTLAGKPSSERAHTLRAEADQSASWAEFISLQAPSDQVYLEELDRRYFGVMSFRSEDERNYMLQAGFPTPREWLSAKRMTDSELQALADAGDPKIAGILADRMSVRLGTLIAMDEAHLEDVGDDERAFVATAAVAYATQALQGSPSPFGVYVEGMVKSSIFNSWEPMTAAMFEGMRRGDPRAGRLIEELHAQHPLQDIGAIHASLKGISDDRR